MSFKCVLIDDEQYAVDAMANYVNDMPNLSLLRTYTDPLVALSEINSADQIDFIFLDIEMPVLSGLELAKILRPKTKFLIFITNNVRHAVEAFDYQPNHFLPKPVSFAKFALTVNEILKNNSQAHSAKSVHKDSMFIKAGQKNSFRHINFNEIIHIEANRNYVLITIKTNENFSANLGLNHIEEILPAVDFIRINRSFIIAKNQIRKIDGNCIKLKNNNTFQVGEAYKSAFFKFVHEHMVAK